MTDLPFHSPVYDTYHVCRYLLWMEDNQIGCSRGERSEPPACTTYIGCKYLSPASIEIACSCGFYLHTYARGNVISSVVVVNCHH